MYFFFECPWTVHGHSQYQKNHKSDAGILKSNNLFLSLREFKGLTLYMLLYIDTITFVSVGYTKK